MPTCYQRGFYKKLDSYTNTTLVADFDDPPGADIFPYPRPSGYEDGVADADCGSAGYPLCGPWPRADRPTTATPPEVYHDWNTYEDAGAKVCVSACPDGHKVVQSIKAWHGRVPHDFNCAGGCEEDTTRYRTVERWCQYTYTGDFVVDPGGADIAATHYIDLYNSKYTVDANTGVITQNTCSHTIIGYDALDNEYVYGDDPWSIAVDEVSPWHAQLNFCDDWTNQVAGTECSGSSTVGACISQELLCLLNAKEGGAASDLDFQTACANYATATGFTVTLTKAADEIESLIEYTSGAITYKYETRCTLTNAYASTTLKSDCEILLEEWDLRQDGILPWRDDAWRGLGVIVHHDGVLSGIDPDTKQACGWTDSNAAIGYTGDVLGSPFTLGWPDKTFGWDHETWHCWGGGPSWEVSYYGATSGTEGLTPVTISPLDVTDAVIPTTASHWTTNKAAGEYRPGSWMWFDSSINLMRMQKEIESKVKLPAYSFFRPCGSDRWMIDTSIASCVVLISGVDVDTVDPLTGLTTDDLVVFVGGANDGKVFEVAAISGTDLTLGTEITAPAGIADAFTHWESLKSPNRLDQGVVGKVRFPDAWPICGKIACASEQDGGNIVVTLSTPAEYMMTGDKVEFVAADDSDTILDDNGAAGYTVTMVDTTHFTVSGTFDAAKHSVYVKSFGAPAAKWSTTASRNDFVWQEWPNYTATGTLDATPVNEEDTALTRRVLGSTPNADTNNGWITSNYTGGYPWPSTLTLTTCGAEWQVMPIQFMVDPLWQTPFACDANPVSVCATRVEARSTVPAGAPSLPVGVTLGIPTTAPEGAGFEACYGGATVPLDNEVPWIPCT